MSNRIARAFNISGGTRTVILNISKVFESICHAGLEKRHISSFPSNKRFVDLKGNCSLESHVNVGCFSRLYSWSYSFPAIHQLPSESKVKFRQASNRYKRVLEDAKLVYANKTKESIAYQKLGSRGIW